VKSPKVYVRDTGLLHSLFNLSDRHALMGHPRVGASWEGFVLEQVATKSMRIAISDLGLKHRWIIYPGTERFPINKHIATWPLRDVAKLRGELR
jgi:hypothetical protein